MTDKATVEVPTPVAGRVLEVRGGVGDKLAVGSELLRIEVGGVAGATPARCTRRPRRPRRLPRRTPRGRRRSRRSLPRGRAQPSSPASRPPGRLASPSVRRHARELGVDLRAGRGHGARRPDRPRRRRSPRLRCRGGAPRAGRRAAAREIATRGAPAKRRSRSWACAGRSPRECATPCASSTSPTSRKSTSPSSRRCARGSTSSTARSAATSRCCRS